MSTNYINNSLFIEKVKIETLVKNNLTPFYVYSSDSIKENFNLLKKILEKIYIILLKQIPIKQLFHYYLVWDLVLMLYQKKN